MPKAGSNPLEVIQDPRVVSTAGGALTAQIARKALFEQSRDMFGFATAIGGGSVKYYAPKKDASGKVTGFDKDKEVPGAYTNRILTHLAFVVAGTLLIGGGDGLDDNKNDDELNLAYFGLGFAGSGFANFVAAILNLDL